MNNRFVRYTKQYVRVVAELGADGNVTPLYVIWPDGRRFDIDRVVDTGFSTSSKTGCSGVRYAVQIAGQNKVIWRDGRGFFVECPHQRSF